jgi:hypothetical protein
MVEWARREPCSPGEIVLSSCIVPHETVVLSYHFSAGGFAENGVAHLCPWEACTDDTGPSPFF